MEDTNRAKPDDRAAATNRLELPEYTETPPELGTLVDEVDSIPTMSSQGHLPRNSGLPFGLTPTQLSQPANELQGPAAQSQVTNPPGHADNNRRRSAWRMPGELRGSIPMYPWGSAWSFVYHKCDHRQRDKGGFTQHMRDIHLLERFYVAEVVPEICVWRGWLDWRDFDPDETEDWQKEMTAEMEFDASYAAANPNTGQNPPREADAAYNRSEGKDLKVLGRVSKKPGMQPPIQ